VQLSLATREKQTLTSPPEGIAGDLEPSFSPDGALLAFVRAGDSKLGKLDIWIQPVDGGPPRRLTFGDYEFCGDLTWTPAGDEVVFSFASEGVFGLTRRVSLEGGDPQPIPELGVNASSATIRGARMVYRLADMDQLDIWRVGGRKATLADRTPEKLIDSSMEDLNASYSPDGRKIAFQSMRSGTSNIWMSNSDGSDPVQLTSFDVMTGTPRWSPDGRTIVFDSGHAENYDLYVVDSEGGSPRRLTHDPSSDTRPSFSRDGQWIYFVSDRDGSFQIWKLPAGGGAAIQVTREGGQCATESWDGRYLYYGKPEYESAIWRVPVGGGPETEVIAGPLYHCFDWSLVEDGIYYAKTQGLGRGQEYTIQFFDFESGQSTEVFRKTGPFHHWTVAASPDEEWVLYGERPFLTSELILVENFR
jgi:Tol biopolymer transport system component